MHTHCSEVATAESHIQVWKDRSLNEIDLNCVEWQILFYGYCLFLNTGGKEWFLLKYSFLNAFSLAQCLVLDRYTSG